MSESPPPSQPVSAFLFGAVLGMGAAPGVWALAEPRSWFTWGCVLVGVLSATVCAAAYYANWSVRFQDVRAGAVAEIAFLVLILSLGLAGVGFLFSRMP